jgi:hypothetical protein
MGNFESVGIGGSWGRDRWAGEFARCNEELRGESGSVVEEEMREGLMADVDGEQFAEECGASSEGAQGSGAELGVAVEEE